MKLMEQGCATGPDAAYGTPEMARALMRLLRESESPQPRIFAMAGHLEGVIAVGRSLGEALSPLLPD
jgi:hypothetical protein